MKPGQTGGLSEALPLEIDLRDDSLERRYNGEEKAKFGAEICR